MTMEQKMHELLCAYALGEVDAAQRIEVERALAASPELRQELEKIEDTIGLVRETLGGGETMSAEAEQALMSAVNPSPKVTPWYSNGWMRMAASFLVIGGGAIWMHRLYEMNTRGGSSSELALLEKEVSRKGAPSAAAPKSDESDLIAQLEEKEKRDRAPGEARPQTDAGAPAPAEQLMDMLVFAEEEATSNNPNNPNVKLNEPPPGDKNGYYTWRDTAVLQAKDGAEIPPVVMERNSLEPSAQSEGVRGNSAPAAPASKPGLYKGPGDSVAQSTPKGESALETSRQAGAGGGGGNAPYKGAGDTVTQGASGAAGPATGSAVTKSREELSLASGGKRASDSSSDDRKAQAEGKEKAEASAKKLAELRQKQVPTTPAAGSDTFFLGAAEAQKPAPADEAQVRLRRLLDRADSAEVDRLARLKGGLEPGQTAGYAGLAYVGGEDRDNEVSLRELYFKLTPEQRTQLLDQECRRVFDGCRRLPNERPRDMFFRYWGDNPFEITALDPLSTFSADVDTASYTLARRYLVEGKLPEKAQIRTEEFVNYFKADVAAPTKGVFAIHTDLAPSRFAQPANSTWTLRVVVRGKELPKEERKPLHLTCVIDCSGSMREQNRMETVKDTLRLLLAQLNSADMVGIVAFSTEARQILPLTSVANRGLIEVAIQQLAPDGWTNSEAGLRLGYETALAGLDAQATNRVVFLSDGVANQGVTDPVQLSNALKPIREQGVYLNTIGVGMNNHNDALLEQLADKGDGICSYVDDMREAKRVMMDNFMGSVETIARDVKIQVDFDPAQVTKYRLLGYENRAVADADFRNDKVDAGEIGSGHQVTALYEIERSTAVVSEKPLATVRLRYKAPRIVRGPANEEATEIKAEVLGSKQTSFEGSDAGYRRAVIVGQYAEFLRRSVHARGRSLDELLVEAHKLEAQIPQDTEFREFVALVESSKQLVLRNLHGCDELCQAIDAYRTWQFQCAQAERLSHERQQQIVDDLARQNRDMEEKIRELLRRRLENSPK